MKPGARKSKTLSPWARWRSVPYCPDLSRLFWKPEAGGLGRWCTFLVSLLWRVRFCNEVGRREFRYHNDVVPFRYRKSLRLAPGLRLNFAKRGASLSVGGPGFTRNFSRRGVWTTISAPGTGLSYSWRSRSRRKHRGGSVLGGLVLLVLVLAVIRVLFGG